MQQDHHGLVAETYTPRGPWRALLHGFFMAIPAMSLTVGGLAIPGEIDVGPIRYVIFFAAVVIGAFAAWATVDTARESMKRVTVRMSTDALEIEAKPLFGRRKLTRLPLHGLRSEVAYELWGDLKVWFGWTVRLRGKDGQHHRFECNSKKEALRLHGLLQAAIAQAAPPQKPAPIPAALDRMRRARSPERS